MLRLQQSEIVHGVVGDNHSTVSRMTVVDAPPRIPRTATALSFKHPPTCEVQCIDACDGDK